jgi:hypothetical protein
MGGGTRDQHNSAPEHPASYPYQTMLDQKGLTQKGWL